MILMEIEFYHWVNKGMTGHQELSTRMIIKAGREDCVVISKKQKRYYIPEHLKSYKKEIVDYMKLSIKLWPIEGEVWTAKL